MPSYQQLRGEVATGDIILFSGKGAISWTIQRITKSKWSHVGMVVRDERFDQVLLWESTTLSNVPDVLTRRLANGVQIVPLSERVAGYDGNGVALRKIRWGRANYNLAALGKLRRELYGRPYERSLVELFKSAKDKGQDQVEDLSSLFCSELVAEAYQRIGLLREPPHDRPSNEYTPADFGEDAAQPLLLMGGASLGPEIEIALPLRSAA